MRKNEHRSAGLIHRLLSNNADADKATAEQQRAEAIASFNRALHLDPTYAPAQYYWRVAPFFFSILCGSACFWRSVACGGAASEELKERKTCFFFFRSAITLRAARRPEEAAAMLRDCLERAPMVAENARPANKSWNKSHSAGCFITRQARPPPPSCAPHFSFFQVAEQVALRLLLHHAPGPPSSSLLRPASLNKGWSWPSPVLSRSYPAIAQSRLDTTYGI